MSEREEQVDRTPTVEELQKKVRALERKLALSESNLTRMRMVSAAQERVESVQNDSLKKELQFFKLVLENATNILLLLDFDGRFAYASQTFLAEAELANFGLINGRHYADVLRPIIAEESLNKFTEAVNQAVAEKRSVTLEEHLDFSFRGIPRTFSIIITPMTDEETGKSTGIMAIFNDITKINDAMETAQRANLAKSDFLANMSHEIRTPLNAIIGMAEIAQGSEDLSKVRYCLEKIDDSSKHLLGIINDILDMSKIEANHFELSFSEFVFERMLLRIVDVMRFKIEEKNIALTVYCAPAVPYAIYSDEQRLAQVVMNILSNAIKFTPESGQITLRVEAESVTDNDCLLRVSIKDSGIGISEDQKPRLFKAFSQADSSISRKYGGTGLGLAISKSIINLLDGDIWFDSEPGEGTTFIFTIRTAARRWAPEIRTPEMRLLAIDGSPEVRACFLRYAQKIGAKCNVAENADAAREALCKESYGFVFVDWRMPGGGVLPFIREARKSGNAETIVLMVSAADWTEVESEAKQAGVNEFISKPILLPIIEQVLDKYGKERGSERDDECDDFTDKTVLLVDDIDINREVIIALLEHTGLNIICAENGREAVEAFTAEPDMFDLIFMDVQMPEMDGYEATRRIRASGIETAQRIPIVAMTANVFKEDVDKCLAAGMNDHIGKPVSIDEVLSKLRTWIYG